MTKIYELTYYRLYRLVDKFSDGSVSHISAAVLWAILQMSCFILAGIIGIYFELIKKGVGFSYGALISYLIALCICSANVYFVLKHDRYKSILKKYAGQRYNLASFTIDALLVLLVILMIIFARLTDEKFPI